MISEAPFPERGRDDDAASDAAHLQRLRDKLKDTGRAGSRKGRGPVVTRDVGLV
jgi:hypothetical protein